MAIVNTILYILLIIEIIVLIYNRKVLFSLITDLLGKNEEKPEEQKSKYKEVKSYILKELNKGFTFEQISDTLLKVGWGKEMIDLVINDVKSRKQY